MVASRAVPLLDVVRDGVLESQHGGHVVVCDTDGTVVAQLGDAELPTYVRSAAKPFQALATLDLLAEAGVALDTNGLAIACASHDGTATHQIEAARLLAEAGLDETALQCPPALPTDVPTMLAQREPQPLAHNCSGKHASFLLAHSATGGDPADYLRQHTPLQRRVYERLAEASSATPTGPGIDGCGAPAWVLSLRGLATGFARLAAGQTPELRRIRSTMTARPALIGGDDAFDTQMMRASNRVVAKRGAEAVLAAGLEGETALGIAVKIADGGKRADGPVLAAVLEGLGALVPAPVRHPVVLGGGRPHGALEVRPEVLTLLR
ncbi:MAG: asparaginase [Actinomycetota bacterium]|jgi:L-asparaginase II|nr:asparaginase [Euzebyaceae bacterium]MDQ3452894.1 asparaginase [Actinomycetota bacterium]